jgi:hypothetical protein
MWRGLQMSAAAERSGEAASDLFPASATIQKSAVVK